jgi:hypothetical protein
MLSASSGDTGGIPALMDRPTTRKVGWAFTPILAAPSRARRLIADQLHRWGVTGPNSEPVLLVANELVANAVDHARTDFELAMSFDGTAVVVEVHDQSMLEPRLQPHNPTAARGRGLQMVDALAKSWRCIHDAGGKTVQAVIVLGILLRCSTISLRIGSASALDVAPRLFDGATPTLAGSVAYS